MHNEARPLWWPADNQDGTPPDASADKSAQRPRRRVLAAAAALAVAAVSVVGINAIATQATSIDSQSTWFGPNRFGQQPNSRNRSPARVAP
ncbi:MAG: hypothetical protein ABIQ39_07665 [Ilumatobacteraceae bacterium]